MGWRQRDWARFNDDERHALFGGGRKSLPPSAEGAAHQSQPPPVFRRARAPRRRQKVGETTLALIVALGLVAFAYDHAHGKGRVQSVTIRRVPPLSSATPKSSPTLVPPPADLLAVRWRSTDLVPAPYAGRICVTDARHGRICASYVVGERPADSLTREIERRGLRVQSSQ